MGSSFHNLRESIWSVVWFILMIFWKSLQFSSSIHKLIPHRIKHKDLCSVEIKPLLRFDLWLIDGSLQLLRIVIGPEASDPLLVPNRQSSLFKKLIYSYEANSLIENQLTLSLLCCLQEFEENIFHFLLKIWKTFPRTFLQ